MAHTRSTYTLECNHSYSKTVSLFPNEGYVAKPLGHAQANKPLILSSCLNSIKKISGHLAQPLEHAQAYECYLADPYKRAQANKRSICRAVLALIQPSRLSQPREIALIQPSCISAHLAQQLKLVQANKQFILSSLLSKLRQTSRSFG